MVIKPLLTLGLLAALVYALLQQSSTRLLRFLMAVVVLLGVYLVWFPGHTMVLADWVGVGRGADLIMYLWIVISVFLILILHLRINRLTESLTELTRTLALRDADAGESADPGPDER